MHDIIYSFLKGLVFGFTMAAVPGPIFFLIIQRTLSEGILTGLFCGIGAITADTVYALIAAVGLTFIMQFLLAYQMWITLLGGFFLLYLAITTYKRTPEFKQVDQQNSKLITAWLSTFLLTMSNPVTIVSYCLIFASLGLGEAHGSAALFALVGGVLLGATSLVLLLISFLKYFRQNLTIARIALVNKTAALILFGFGVATIIKSINTMRCG